MSYKSKLLKLAKKLDEPEILIDILGENAFKLFTEQELRSERDGKKFSAKVRTFTVERSNAVTKDGKNIDTELLNALNRNNFLKARELINNGAWINQSTIFGSSSLMLAVMNDDLETAKLLILKGVKVDTLPQNFNYNIIGRSALTIAALNGKNDMDELLLQNGADVNYGIGNAANIAIRNQDLKIIEKLLKYNAINVDHLTAKW